jgi:hypothetical protein
MNAQVVEDFSLADVEAEADFVVRLHRLVS